jgi:hypothetical protein
MKQSMFIAVLLLTSASVGAAPPQDGNACWVSQVKTAKCLKGKIVDIKQVVGLNTFKGCAGGGSTSSVYYTDKHCSSRVESEACWVRVQARKLADSCVIGRKVPAVAKVPAGCAAAGVTFPHYFVDNICKTAVGSDDNGDRRNYGSRAAKEFQEGHPRVGIPSVFSDPSDTTKITTPVK